MACRRKGTSLFIGNLKQSTKSFGLVWFGIEGSWIGYYLAQAAAEELQESASRPQVRCHTPEIEQTGHKWDRGLSFSVGSHFRTIPYDWVTTFFSSLSLILTPYLPLPLLLSITTTKCLGQIKCLDRSFRCLSHKIKLKAGACCFVQ